MIAPLLLFALAAGQAPDDDYDKTHINTVLSVEGRYLPMVTQALRRPEMRGRRIDCYEVRVMRWEGAWQVVFSGYREPLPPDEETENGTIIHVGHRPPNADCPDIGFEFDDKGRIKQVLRWRE